MTHRARILAPLTFLALSAGATAAFAIPGAHGPAAGNRPEIVRPVNSGVEIPGIREVHRPLDFQIAGPDADEQKKNPAATFGVTGGREQFFDSNVSPLSAFLGTNYQGTTQNGWIPYDGAVAVSGTQVVSLTNAQFGVYDKATGNRLLLASFDGFFGTAGGTAFDPKVFYDATAGRFVLMAVKQSSSGNTASIEIAVSQTSDATGAYYKYSFDATRTGSTPTGTWSDYPSLGYDDNNVSVGSNQYSFSNSFQFAKVRCFSKSQLYSGGAASYVDFAPVTLAGGGSAFTVKAGRNLTASAVGHFLATQAGGGGSVSTWTVTGTFPSLSLSGARTVPVGNYAVPPDARQAGGGKLVATGDCRTQDVVWQGGTYTTAFTEKTGNNRHSAADGIRVLQINDAGSVVRDISYSASGSFLYYPAISVDPSGNAALIFERSSGTEYASVYETRIPAGGAVDASQLVKAGVSANTTGRWGDYDGIANDPSNPSVLWGVGGYDNGNRWATWIAALTPSVASAPSNVQPAAFSAPAVSRQPAGAGFGFASALPPMGADRGRLRFILPGSGHATVDLYDVAGRRVSRLFDGEANAGENTVSFAGRSLAQGVYFARLSAAGLQQVRRVVLIGD